MNITVPCVHYTIFIHIMQITYFYEFLSSDKTLKEKYFFIVWYNDMHLTCLKFVHKKAVGLKTTGNTSQNS